MNTQQCKRTAAAGAIVGLLAAGAGVLAIGTGAIAMGSANGGAAIVTHQPGFRTVTLQPGKDLVMAAKDLSYDQQICSDSWLAGYGNCATDLQRCAAKYHTSPVAVDAVFYEPTGRLGSCRPVS